MAGYLAAVAGQAGGIPANYPPPRAKRYPGSRRWPLPWPGPGVRPPGRTEVDRLAALLLGYAPRRLEFITTSAFAAMNGRPATIPQGARLLPVWFAARRGVPSGGAFYPAELYVAWAGAAGLPPGIYHYDSVHHALEQIRPGDPAAGLDLLLGDTGPQPRHALVVTCRVWKNAGKYRAFGYQLSMMDSGALLGQLAGSALAGRVRLVGIPAAAEDLLRLDGAVETAVAVVELPAAHLGDAPAPGASAPDTGPPAGVPPAPAGLDGDRHNLAGADSAVIALHQAVRAGGEPAPTPGARPSPRWVPKAGGPPPVDLPQPAAPSRAATAHRASANDLAPGLTVGQLATVLAYAGGHRAGGALTGHPGHPAFWCLVTRVEGLAPGGYRYDRQRHRLWPSTRTGAGAAGTPGALNPAMSTAGASLFVVAEPDPPIHRLDPVALRDLYLRTGVSVQLAALAAQAAGAATRPLGGFDAEAVTTALGLPPGAVPLLQLLLGRPKPRAGALAVAFTEGSADV